MQLYGRRTQNRFTVADIGVGLAAHRWVQPGERFSSTLEAPKSLPSLERWLLAVTGRPAFAAAVADPSAANVRQ